MRGILACALVAAVLGAGCNTGEQVGPAGPRKGVSSSGEDSPGTGATEGRHYWVQKGDTLAAISRKYYGDTRHWKRIAEANSIADPNKIHPGQRLVIPPLD